MPKNAQTEIFEDWATMVRAARKSKACLAGVEPYLGTLEKAHQSAVKSRKQRDVLSAASQEATQQLQYALADGRDAASRLRSFIKSKLGAHSEQLVAFGIQPIRRRRRKLAVEGIAN